MYIYIHYIDIHKSMTQYIMYVLLEDSPIGVILILPKVWRRSTPMARVAHMNTYIYIYICIYTRIPDAWGLGRYRLRISEYLGRLANA